MFFAKARLSHLSVTKTAAVAERATPNVLTTNEETDL
jgi:hypothetical protein